MAVATILLPIILLHPTTRVALNLQKIRKTSLEEVCQKMIQCPHHPPVVKRNYQNRVEAMVVVTLLQTAPTQIKRFDTELI